MVSVNSVIRGLDLGAARVLDSIAGQGSSTCTLHEWAFLKCEPSLKNETKQQQQQQTLNN